MTIGVEIKYPREIKTLRLLIRSAQHYSAALADKFVPYVASQWREQDHLQSIKAGQRARERNQ